MPRITLACPEPLMDDANQLAAATGYSMADAQTFVGASWQDSNANLYSAASLDVSDEWLAAAQQPLVRPAWDVDQKIDMAAATRAQSVVNILTEPALATVTQITVLPWPSGPEALALLGLNQASSLD